jgi:nitroreductase
MDVYQAIKSRRTVRDYKPDLIPEDVLRKILQAARWAPSSSNTQKWSFIVIQDREILAKLGEVAKQGHERNHPFRTIRGHDPGTIGPN